MRSTKINLRLTIVSLAQQRLPSSPSHFPRPKKMQKVNFTHQQSHQHRDPRPKLTAPVADASPLVIGAWSLVIWHHPPTSFTSKTSLPAIKGNCLSTDRQRICIHS